MTAVLNDPVLKPFADGFRRLQRNSVRLVALEPETTLAVGQSRVGGMPDVPAEFVWPTMKIIRPAWLSPTPSFGDPDSVPLPLDGVIALQFLAQINLTEVSPFDSDKILPTVGQLLFFFHDAVSQHDFDSFDQCRVLFLKPEVKLKRLDQVPRNICKPAWRPDVFAELALTFSTEATLPGLDDYVLARNPASDEDRQCRLCLDSEAETRYAALHYGIRANGTLNQMLGWPDIFSHGAFMPKGAFDAEAVAPVRSSTDRVRECMEIRLLLQVSLKLQDQCGMDFGRTLFFFIREADLKRRDFSKVWWDME